MTAADRQRHQDVHQEMYGRQDVVTWYAGRDELQVVERAIFTELAGFLTGARALDIGVGGGRTTLHLKDRVAEYVGCDYSPDLVAATADRFPNVRVEFADVRDLSTYADDSFDFVLFSFNGLASLGHEDRLLGLREIRRVLRPGGYFMFSAHNRDHRRFGLLPWQHPDRVGRVMVKKSWEAIRATPNRRRMRRLETSNEVYALHNDEAHEYGLLHYYISPQRQLEQLRQVGFEEARFYDRQGRPDVLDDGALWVYYLAR